MAKRVNRDRWLCFSQVKSKGFKPWPDSANWRSQWTPPNTTPLAPPAVPSNRTAAYERFIGYLSCRGVVAKIGARGLSDQKSERRTLLPLSPCGSPCGRGWLASSDARRVRGRGLSIERAPSSGASRHLLPQGEKGRKIKPQRRG